MQFPRLSLSPDAARQRRRQGFLTCSKAGAFALVVVLSLMALLVLLLLSLSQILRVESGSAAASVAASRARGMALFGMQKALGELQSLAGPDRRVTATASLLGGGGVTTPSDPSKKHWTGVWNSAGYDPASPDNRDFLGWLVSSPTLLDALSDASGALPAESIELVGEGTVGSSDPNDRVSAPLVPVVDGDSNPIGEFAYWIGDEGVKAKFDLPLPSKTEALPQRARYDFMASQRNAVELVGGLDANFSFAMATDPRARRMAAREQIEMLGGTADGAREHFHDISLFSSGVLSDTANGGLRKDLTWLFEESPGASLSAALASVDADPSIAGSQITREWPSDPTRLHWFPSPTFELLRSFYRMKDEPLPLQPRKQTGVDHGILPVIARCSIYFRPGMRTEGGQSFLRVNLDVQLLLWNPYNVPIAGREYDLEIAMNSFDMALQIGSSDHGRVHDMTGTGGAGFRVYENNFAAPATGRSITFRIPAVPIAPGESLIFTMADTEDGTPYSGSNRLANQPPVPSVPNTVWLEHPTPLNQSPPISNFRLRRQPSPDSSATLSGNVLSISLKDPGTGGDNSPAGYWSRTGRRSAEGSTPPYVDPNLATLENALLSSNVALLQQLDASLFSGSGYRNERWIANYNPRAVASDQSPADSVNNPSYSFNWRRGANRNDIPAGHFDGGRVRFLPIGLERYEVSLFEIPTDSLPRLSIADFQHANVHPSNTSNAYLIGNSLLDMRLESGAQRMRLPSGNRTADTHGPVVDGAFLLNESLWDQFFLSTVLPSLTDADISAELPLPNARMRPRPDAMAADLKNFDSASAHLMLEGAFNVNSTSIEAWKAFLAGRRGLNFNPVTGVPSGELRAGYSRLSRPQGEANAPWRGFRDLSDSQIQMLAEKIVDEVLLRGPFMSIANFVNRRLGAASDPRVIKGALARAIDEAALNDNSSQGLPDAVNDGSNWSPAGQPQAWYLEASMLGSRHEGATNWITQGDILQAIGGAISVRSDTFVIRSFGRTFNRSGDIEAEAWCEAIVQRVPDPVDPSPANPNEPTDPERHGRRFEVVSFRWLDRDSL